MIRNLSLTLESIVEPTAKEIAPQQQSVDFLSEVALDNRIAFVYLLAGQGGICSVANTTCCTWINTSGEVETHLHTNTKQASCLKGWLLHAVLSLTYLIFIGLVLGIMALSDTPDIGNYPTNNSHGGLSCHSLSNLWNACL